MSEVAERNDYETAEAIRDGLLPSPTKFGESWFFDLRITGTGAAFRDSIDEWAYRDVEAWTSPEFLQRCNGLPVIFEHPERSGLNAEEFRERVIGTIRIPYVKGDEVWGVAQIYDADAAALMQTTHTSTSPGVTPPQGSEPEKMKDGANVLVEGLPLILDHLAVCENGVWDKDGPPRGIRLDRKDSALAKTAEDLEKELDDAKKRADAAEKERDDAKARMDAMMDKAKKDESDKEAIAKAEAEKADKAKKDAADAKRDSRKDRHAKHDGDILDCSRCDSEEAEEEKEREDKAKKDAAAAAKTEVEADRGTEFNDAKERISRLEAELARVRDAQRPLSMEDRDEIAKAWVRADRAYQMLGDQAPQAIPGETPIAYRRRLANGLRKFTKSWQTYAFHDAQQAQDFRLVEDAIYDEALAYAKNPPGDAMAGKMREVVTYQDGKKRTTFVGDPKAPWLPFQQPTRFAVTSIVRPNQGLVR